MQLPPVVRPADMSCSNRCAADIGNQGKNDCNGSIAAGGQYKHAGDIAPE